MKWHLRGYRLLSVRVTLCVRVWIEIETRMGVDGHMVVTLCVRVWIEIVKGYL